MDHKAKLGTDTIFPACRYLTANGIADIVERGYRQVQNGKTAISRTKSLNHKILPCRNHCTECALAKTYRKKGANLAELSRRKAITHADVIFK
jgi:hypothetical protein